MIYFSNASPFIGFEGENIHQSLIHISHMIPKLINNNYFVVIRRGVIHTSMASNRIRNTVDRWIPYQDFTIETETHNNPSQDSKILKGYLNINGPC